MPGRDFAHAQDDLNLRISHMFEGTFYAWRHPYDIVGYVCFSQIDHYENMPIQIYGEFHPKKLKIFR